MLQQMTHNYLPINSGENKADLSRANGFTRKPLASA